MHDDSDNQRFGYSALYCNSKNKEFRKKLINFLFEILDIHQCNNDQKKNSRIEKEIKFDFLPKVCDYNWTDGC